VSWNDNDELGRDLPPLPPAQPPGWVDPDPLYVEPELVTPKPVRRRRYQGWEFDRPTPHWFAWFGLGICVGVILLAIVITVGRAIDATPSREESGGSRVTAGIPAASPLGGAPHAASSLAATGGSAPQPRSEAPVPSPTGAIGTALVGGWATWWDTCADCAAAGPLLQTMVGPDWQGRTVTVVSAHGSQDLRLVTSCACGDRKGKPTFIDVSVEAWSDLSPYPARSDRDPGVIAVSIEIPGASTTLPPTDPTPHPDDERMRLEVRGDELYR
jgi:hypothetical protein